MPVSTFICFKGSKLPSSFTSSTFTSTFSSPALRTSSRIIAILSLALKSAPCFLLVAATATTSRS